MMGAQLTPAQLTPAQRAILAAWPAFESAAAVKWCSVDRLVRALSPARSLAELADDDAEELLAWMRRATARLVTMAQLQRLAAPSHRGHA